MGNISHLLPLATMPPSQLLRNSLLPEPSPALEAAMSRVFPSSVKVEIFPPLSVSWRTPWRRCRLFHLGKHFPVYRDGGFAVIQGGNISTLLPFATMPPSQLLRNASLARYGVTTFGFGCRGFFGFNHRGVPLNVRQTSWPIVGIFRRE